MSVVVCIFVGVSAMLYSLFFLFFFFFIFFFFFFLFLFLFFFFFFKQKTAYEILTCDWSSDVCSSDLIFYHPAVWHVFLAQKWPVLIN